MAKKFKYIGCFLLLFVFMNCSAQQLRTNTKSRFGLIIYPTFTKASLVSYIPSAWAFKNYERSYIGAGIGIKVYRLLFLNKKFSLQPELGISIYNQKQTYCDNNKLNTLGSVSYFDKLSEYAISLSAVLNYKFKSFSVSAGPQFDIVSAAKINSVSRLNGYGYTNRINSETNFKKEGETYSDVFLLVLGISKYKISKKFGVGVFYLQGLSDFTRYYDIRQIAQINGVLLEFDFSF